MSIYKTPGVYTEEVSTTPPSVVQVSTAIPAFMGNTEKSGDKLKGIPVRITSLLEYKEFFGGPELAKFAVTVDQNDSITEVQRTDPGSTLYYSMDLYFKNGGGACYIISLGDYGTQADKASFLDALEALSMEDEPTLIVLNEATRLADVDYYEVCQAALAQCADLKDRFCIFDVLKSDKDASGFRNGIGTHDLKYGAAYTPYLQTSLNCLFKDSDVSISGLSLDGELSFETDEIRVTYSGPDTDAPKVKINKGTDGAALQFSITDNTLSILNVGEGVSLLSVMQAWASFSGKGNFDLEQIGDDSDLVVNLAQTNLTPSTSGPITLSSLKSSRTALYGQIVTALAKERMVLAPGAAIAGVYCKTDRERGVWKAPANISLSGVIAPTRKISSAAQENLNMDANAGKSINAIRSFSGKGTLIWGARTLAGNDNDWRYISVRRLFNMVEESTQKASQFAVFEPNDGATWLKVKAMIESFLYGIWQQGALAGSTPEQAYFVNVGLGKTMTQQDILEGRMVVEIGIAAVRPAEFIILKFSHKLQES